MKREIKYRYEKTDKQPENSLTATGEWKSKNVIIRENVNERVDERMKKIETWKEYKILIILQNNDATDLGRLAQ